MIVRVRLFGPQAQLSGASVIDVEVQQAEATSDAVLSAIGQQCEPLAASLGASRLAVNHEFATAEQPITPDDEVALIGMVSGG